MNVAPQSIYSQRAGTADQADLLDGREANDFVLRAGDTVTGSLEVDGSLTAGAIAVPSGDVEFGIEHGLSSSEGAELGTGPEGKTFQFSPGSGTAHIAIFRDFSDNPVVSVDGAGRLGIGTFTPSERLTVTGNVQATGNLQAGANLMVGGICFRPRPLVRCWLANITNHLTWVDRSAECTNAGGTVEIHSHDSGPVLT